MQREGYSVDQVLAFAAGEGISHLILLDQKVAGIEEVGVRTPYGYECSKGGLKLTVIDHHVSDPDLSKVSTGNLCLEYYRVYPEGPPQGSRIGITHGDCDSVISAALMLGVVPPDTAFGEAVMAADHTFGRNQIADLLQSIEVIPPGGKVVHAFNDGLSEVSLEQSIRNLGLLLQGKALDPSVDEALAARQACRDAWSARLNAGQIRQLSNGTCVAILDGPQSHDPVPEFLVGMLPEATLFLVFHEVPNDRTFNQVRAVAGEAAPEVLDIGDRKLISEDLVARFGGRKDAGSNRRGGLSFTGDPTAVAEEIDRRLGLLMQASNS